LFFFLLFTSYLNADKVADEYDLKAAFIEKFARFIDWPDDKFEKSDTFFEITVLGKNPFGDKLDKLYSKQKIKNLPVKIKYVSTINEIGNPHLLFISPSMKNSIQAIINVVKDKSILTIGQTSGFCEKGVHINFKLIKSKLKFQINELSAKKSNLKINHLLLRNAEIIKTESEEK